MTRQCSANYHGGLIKPAFHDTATDILATASRYVAEADPALVSGDPEFY